MALAAFGFSAVALQAHQAAAEDFIPDTPDSRQIIVIINKAYDQMVYASETSDVSGFASVFVDTEDYKLNDVQQVAIAQELGLNAPEISHKHIGYLTAMQMQYISWGEGRSLLQRAVDKAKAENRDITREELQEVIKANHGQVPPSPNVITSKTVLVFESIEINSDKAIVKYDDGAALQEAILIKRSGNWLIASIVPILIHY
jgi:hypothetical protein